jgi:RNA polymerase sigma-B factor
MPAEVAMSLISSGPVPAGESTQVLPAPAGRIRQELAELDDRELLDMAGSLPRSSQRRAAACELLVGRHRGLVRACVQRYRSGPEPAEDLMQVGYVGLVKAINSFDPAVGRSLAAYAWPCITGEIKRHFRDKRWQLHVTRAVKELAMQARAATWQLTQELGRTPAESDLARHLRISGHELRDAQLAEMAFQPSSLDAPLSGKPGAAMLADLLGEEDPELEHMLGMQAVAAHWGELPPREQKILLMYFYDDMTQAQIGQQLGISQMHVSRLLGRALSYLRPRVLGLDEHGDLADVKRYDHRRRADRQADDDPGSRQDSVTGRERGEHHPGDKERRGAQHRGPAAYPAGNLACGQGADQRLDQQDAGQQFLVEGRQAVKVLADD